MPDTVHLVECPRDAFQGLPQFIPTETKVAHLNRIIAAGLREIDFGSFVSPKAIPQMADTEAVLHQLAREIAVLPRLIAIIANEKGLDRAAAAFDPIRDKAASGLCVGYPLSVAEGFQQRNTGKSIDESWPLVELLQQRCAALDIDLIVYLSMAFGNPDNEPWSAQLVVGMARRLIDMGVRTISLADTIGAATPAQVREVFTASQSQISKQNSAITLGAHFHAAPGHWLENVTAAFDAGGRRFDTSLGGYGGCPYAKSDLVGNIPTEHVVETFARTDVESNISNDLLQPALDSARNIFATYGHA